MQIQCYESTFHVILIGGTIHGKEGPSTAAVDDPAGPVTAADHLRRDITNLKFLALLVFVQ